MEHNGDVSRKVAAVLRRRLADENISLRSAAEKTGIPLTTLARRINGTSPLSVTELTALASLLGSTPSGIVAEAESGNWDAA